MKRASRWVILLLLLGPGSAQAKAERGDSRLRSESAGERKVGASVADQSLPANLRLSVFVSYLARLARDKPDFGLLHLQKFGLSLERAELELLGRLYGDFDSEQRERQDRGVTGEALLLEREEFLGRILGQWLDALKREGHAGEAFLRNVLQDPTLSVSISSDGPLSIKDLDERGRRFGESFGREYGRPLQSILDGEVDRVILLESSVPVAEQHLHVAIRENLELRHETSKRHRVVVFGLARVAESGLLSVKDAVVVTPQCCCSPDPEAPPCI